MLVAFDCLNLLSVPSSKTLWTPVLDYPFRQNYVHLGKLILTEERCSYYKCVSGALLLFPFCKSIPIFKVFSANLKGLLLSLQVLSYLVRKLANEQEIIVSAAVHALQELLADLISIEHIRLLEQIHGNISSLSSLSREGGLLEALLPSLVAARLRGVCKENWSEDEVLSWAFQNVDRCT